MNSTEIINIIKPLAENAMKTKQNIKIALCGKCASGKTTIAKLLKGYISGDIVYLDDFFLPPELRTEERLCEIGGNIHYERINSEICSKLSQNEPFSYNIFDCKSAKFSGKREINPLNPIIVEGIYALHPKFNLSYDLKIYLEIDDQKQNTRILSRDGAQKAQRFAHEWIPMENAFIEFFDIKNQCDIVINV